METNLQTVMFHELETLISKLLGFYVIFEEISIGNNSNGNYFILKSNELKQFTGIQQRCCDSFKITSFGGALYNDAEKGNCYWLPLHFSFSYTSGGSNGVDLFSARYCFKTKNWELK